METSKDASEKKDAANNLSKSYINLTGGAKKLTINDVLSDDLSDALSFIQNNSQDWHALTKFRAFLPVAWRVWSRSVLTMRELTISVECCAHFGKNFRHVLDKRGISSDIINDVLAKFSDSKPKTFETLTLPRVGTAYCDLLIIKRTEMILAAKKVGETITVINEKDAKDFESRGLPRAAQCYGVSDLLSESLLELYIEFNNALTLVYRQGKKIEEKQLEQTRKIITSSIGKGTCFTSGTGAIVKEILGTAACNKLKSLT